MIFLLFLYLTNLPCSSLLVCCPLHFLKSTMLLMVMKSQKIQPGRQIQSDTVLPEDNVGLYFYIFTSISIIYIYLSICLYLPICNITLVFIRFHINLSGSFFRTGKKCAVTLIKGMGTILTFLKL